MSINANVKFINNWINGVYVNKNTKMVINFKLMYDSNKKITHVIISINFNDNIKSYSFSINDYIKKTDKYINARPVDIFHHLLNGLFNISYNSNGIDDDDYDDYNDHDTGDDAYLTISFREC